MLAPPITNLGVKGIRKAAKRIQAWPGILPEKSLRDACINTAIMIDARGGTGGGLFRTMYGRFLREASGWTGLAALVAAADQMQAIGDCWDAAASLFERASLAPEPGIHLAEVVALLPEIAAREEQVWAYLDKVARRVQE
jgi:hypothetical protein